MWKPYYVTAGAAAFDATIEGRPSGAPGAEALAQFIADVAGALRLDAPRPSDAGRARLLTAVEQARNVQRRRAVGVLPVTIAAGGARRGVRGSALAAASVAGGGLLLASAATHTDPVTFVKNAVADFPAFAPVFQVADRPVSHAVTLEGTITVVGATTFSLQTREGVMQATTSEATTYRGADGVVVGREIVSAGNSVRVRGVVRSGGGTTAETVELLGTTGASTPRAATPAPGIPERSAQPSAEVVASPADETGPATAARSPSPTVAVTRSTPQPGDATKPPAAIVTPAPDRTKTVPAATADATRTKEPTRTPEPVGTLPPVVTATASATVEPTRTATPRVTADARPIETAAAAPTAKAKPAPVSAASIVESGATAAVADAVPDGIGSGTSARAATPASSPG